MTITTDEPTTLAPALDGVSDAASDAQPVAGGAESGPSRHAGGEEPAEQQLRIGMTALAAALSTAGAAWLAGGLLREPLQARAIGLGGALLGSVLIALSMRLRRPAVLQYAVLPVAALVGAILIAPEATGGTANLPGLVREALQSGGLKQPPIPFDPGWRFILVVLFAVVSAGAAAVAIGRGKARLAAAVPMPLTFGAALLQPEGNEITAGTVAMFAVVASLAVSYGAALPAAGGQSGKSFELRRLGRGLLMLVVLMGGMIVLARTELLFPDAKREFVVPPQKPPQVPLEADRELARVFGNSRGPWRTGVLDTYDGEAWLLPGLDSDRIVALPQGDVPGRDAKHPGAQEFAFRIVDMRGRGLLVPYGVAAVRADGATLEYDPRPDTVGLDRRVPRGFEYRAVALPLPTRKELNEAPQPTPEFAAQFTAAPPPPGRVIDVLAEAPAGSFDKLQFLRDRLYASVVAAGAGSPVDISPARVGELFDEGAEATPFEITAAEALLARWAGVPARIGFGYFGGDQIPDGFSIRPKDGAAWLEVHFEGHGWVPLVGTPPRAKSSLSEDQANEKPQVLPTDELAARMYIPVQRKTTEALFEIVRYWMVVLTPTGLALLLVVGGYPAVLKRVRSSRRRRWGQAAGPHGRVLVAYSEMRDSCFDLNLGDPRDTPLEFLARFQRDDEHAELAWLVTRALWGDLRRDLRPADVEAAEELARSAKRRIAQMQPATNRVLAVISRVSLRDPYSDDVPNVWPRIRVRGRVRVGSLARPWRLLRRTPRPAPGAAVLLFVAALALTGCVEQGGLEGGGPPAEYPAQVAPPPDGELLGLKFVPRAEAAEEHARVGADALVTDSQFFTIHQDDVVQGSLQVSRFRPELDAGDEGVQAQVQQGVGGGFSLRRVGTIRLFVRDTPEQTFYLWFPPERNVMVLLVMRNRFPLREQVVWGVLGYQRGLPPEVLAQAAVDRGPRVVSSAPVPSARGDEEDEHEGARSE